jgi:predicted ribosome quality control (RQC) complex YloA/Tae2 family protein
MVTDWILIRRAADELEQALRGGRVTDAGLLDDGRFALRIGGRQTGATLLVFDVFGSPPLPALEDAELSIAGDPGWARSIATVLRGLRVGEVRSRHGDRVLVLDFGTTSRFGVVHGVKLVAELIPRFGNVLLLRDGIVLAAAKQFSPAENETRSVGVGGPYRPPPLREASLDDAGFAAATVAAGRDGLVRALAQARPGLPRLLAESLSFEVEAQDWPSPGRRAAVLLERADALLADAAGTALLAAPLHVYRDAGRLTAAHVVPLAQFGADRHTEVAELLPLFAEARATSAGRRAGDATERRRSALRKRIEKRLHDTRAEIAHVAARRDDAAGRDALRAAGDALYTYGTQVEPAATLFVTPDERKLAIALDPELDAKANAARYFARYRKAADALPHLERRLTALETKRVALEELAFETERGDHTTVLEVAAALDALEGRTTTAPRPSARAARTPLRVERPSGARIFVGRSPRENAEVTFRIARPDDLWFHARGIPGSHVVLQSPAGAAPNDDDLDCAADWAARHSRARNAPRVEIDYTERKYVRKQRDAPAGMVWYTNARTRVGHPDSAEKSASESGLGEAQTPRGLGEAQTPRIRP